MKISRPVILATIGVLAFAGSAHAAIVGGEVTGRQAFRQGGTFVQLTPGFTQSNPDNTVGRNTFQNPNLYAFDEGQIIVSDDLASEVAGLSAGMIVESHYIAYDPRRSTTLAGYVDFDAPIVGIATSLNAMLAANTLVSTGVTYLNPRLVGLERRDRATIDNITRILLNFRASSPGDYIRVFTLVQPPEVPLPAAAWMFLAGLAGLAAKGKKRIE